MSHGNKKSDRLVKLCARLNKLYAFHDSTYTISMSDNRLIETRISDYYFTTQDNEIRLKYIKEWLATPMLTLQQMTEMSNEQAISFVRKKVDLYMDNIALGEL